MPDFTATIAEDNFNRSDIRVECVVEHGAVEVAVFSGPNAYARARKFAGSFYSGWQDYVKSGDAAETWVFNRKDSADFVDALTNSPQPNAALREAANRYKS